MKPIGRYLLGWLGSAAGFYAVGLILWPSDPSPVAAAITRALGYGLFVQLFAIRRDLRARDGKLAYSPTFDFGLGLGGLVLVACWRYAVVAPPEVRLFVVFGIVAFSTYFLASGLLLVRRGRASQDGAGT